MFYLPSSKIQDTKTSSYLQQIHKIPGTTYASSSTGSMTTVAGGGESSSMCGSEFGGVGTSDGGTGGAKSSFLMRMEKLRDANSTNLYFEG